MTQGHEPHGEGGRKGEITHQSMWNLIQLSQDQQRASPMAATYHTATITPSGKEAHREGGNEVEPGVKLTREGLVSKANAVQFGHFVGGAGGGYKFLCSPSPDFLQPVYD